VKASPDPRHSTTAPAGPLSHQLELTPAPNERSPLKRLNAARAAARRAGVGLGTMDVFTELAGETSRAGYAPVSAATIAAALGHRSPETGKVNASAVRREIRVLMRKQLVVPVALVAGHLVEGIPYFERTGYLVPSMVAPPVTG
jgi:hypothetical protein